MKSLRRLHQDGRSCKPDSSKQQQEQSQLQPHSQGPGLSQRRSSKMGKSRCPNRSQNCRKNPSLAQQGPRGPTVAADAAAETVTGAAQAGADGGQGCGRNGSSAGTAGKAPCGSMSSRSSCSSSRNNQRWGKCKEQQLPQLQQELQQDLQQDGHSSPISGTAAA